MSTNSTAGSSRQTTTHAPAAVGIAGYASGPVKSLLSPREKHLNHKAPASKSVHQLRRDIKIGSAKPVDMLLRVMFADIDDGIPLPMVTTCLQEMLAIVEGYAARRERRLASGFLPFSQRALRTSVRETKAQSVGDIAVQEVLADPSNPETIRTAIHALQAEDAVREELEMVLIEGLPESQ